MNRQIRRLGVGLVALFVLMFLQLTNLQVLSANRLANHPGNTRNAVRDFGAPRGAIVTADGTVIAQSVRNPDRSSKFRYLRRYPAGRRYGHITGFFSFSFGSTGIERAYNADLAGRRGALTFQRIEDLLRDNTVVSDVRLTIVDSIQRSAIASLGRRRGSVVALDPRTGAVLAMYSYPSFDPAPLSALDQKTVQAEYRRLVADKANPLLPRAYRELYPPGSTFKVVTVTGGLESATIDLETTYPELTELPLPLTNRPLRNFGGQLCGGRLEDAFARSCNTSFAQLGLDLKAPGLSGAATGFGFNSPPPLDLSPGATASRFPSVSFFDRNTPALAQAAIGQGEVAATPLEMALVAAAVANGGRMMAPHLRQEVTEFRPDKPDAREATVERARPRVWQTPMSEETARQVTDLMIAVVEHGTGRRAAIPGVTVAAKTGTAQTGTGRAHAWVVAFAPAEEPTVAVAVIVESQPEVSSTTGGRVAAPIAARVIQSALSADR